MKDVLLSNAGVQVYIIDGSRRTDGAARAVITALYKAGRICKEAAERAWSDRATLDKIKKYMVHCKMETRATETGDRWTFYTKTGVFMDIEAYSRNYITADADGNLYPTEAPTEPETIEGNEDTTAAETEPQEAPQSHETTTSRKSITAPTEGTQEAPQPAGTSEGGSTPPHTEPPRATDAAAGSVSQSDRRTRPAAPQSHETTKGIQRHHRPPKTPYRAIQSTATIPARYHHAQTTTSRGSPKICISWW